MPRYLHAYRYIYIYIYMFIIPRPICQGVRDLHERLQGGPRGQVQGH